jgi:hypothetical protein
MGEIKLILDDKLEQRFRQSAMNRFGYAKGSLSKAAVFALERWVSEEELKNEPFGDPIEAIKGMLKHVKKSSVELQHEIGAVWSKNVRN